MVEQRVVHLPVTALFARSLCCFGRQHRIRVNSDERKMMELEPELLRIPVQDFLHQRVVRSTAGGRKLALGMDPKRTGCRLSRHRMVVTKETRERPLGRRSPRGFQLTIDY